MAAIKTDLTQKEAFAHSTKTGVKIKHSSFEDDEYIFFKKEDGLWYDNEGDTTLPQQFTGNFFTTGWTAFV